MIRIWDGFNLFLRVEEKRVPWTCALTSSLCVISYSIISCPLAGPLPGTLSFLLCNWGAEMGSGAFFIRDSLTLWEARGEGGRPGQGSLGRLGSGYVKNVTCLSDFLPPPG